MKLLYQIAKHNDYPGFEAVVKNEIGLIKYEMIIQILNDTDDKYNQIINLIAITYKVAYNDIMSRNKKGEIAEARMLAMYLIYRFTNKSSIRVGAIFSRDHSTVLYACKIMTERIGLDQLLISRDQYIVMLKDIDLIINTN